MTRKDYEKIAEAVRQVNSATADWGNAFPSEVIELVCRCLCHYFEQDNPRFDRERFLSACGFE